MIKARTFDQVSAERMKAEPTPQTDLLLEQQIVCKYKHDMVSAGFARTLERERNNLKQEVERLKTMSVCELGAYNKNVHGYLEHWENRALTAERGLEEACRRNASLQAKRLQECADEIQLGVELSDVKSELLRVQKEWAAEREKCGKMHAAIRALLEDYDCKNEVMPAYYQALDALGEKK